MTNISAEDYEKAIEEMMAQSSWLPDMQVKAICINILARARNLAEERSL